MTKKIQIFVFIFLSLFSFTATFAQGTSVSDLSNISFYDGGVDSPKTIFKTLSQSNLLKITIATDMDNLIENKNKDDYQPASLTFNSEEGLESHDVKVKPRGKFRRRTCSFPPLKIKFAKSGLADKGLSTNHKSLKLVTHCMDADNAEQTLMKEYVAYKMYNQLTDASFRVQLVEITYVNSAKDTLDEVKYGFIIENTNEMAERIEGQEIEDIYNITLDSINKTYRHLIPMYQFMIANMDWRPHMLQNIKVVDKENGDRIMVPYDFDFAGLVDAPYAIPNRDYFQSDIKERIYMNKVDNIDELTKTIRFFQVKKKEILETIKTNEHLTKKTRRKMTSYINSFYDILDDPMLCQQAFVK